MEKFNTMRGTLQACSEESILTVDASRWGGSKAGYATETKTLERKVGTLVVREFAMASSI